MAKFNHPRLIYSLIGLVVAIITFNQYMLLSATSGKTGFFPLSDTNSIIPKGIPEIYGKELSVNYDDISVNNPSLADSTIKKLGIYDTSITLTGDKLQRYIKIGTSISCEYCCSAQAIIFNDGNAACGCAHSAAMRGLAKYLLDKHANEFTDDQILEELGKWKVLFFPSNAIQKADVLKQKGIELNYINIASNKYRGIEQGASSGGQMVGGC